jgi:hypothetical protein
VRWATDGVKKRTWGQLGLFSGLVCVGSVAGSVAWGAQMQGNAFNYEAGITGINHRQSYSLFASSSRWFATVSILYPVEFLCFIIPKLVMLGRLTTNATRSLQVHAQEQEQSNGVGVRVSLLAIVHRAIATAVVLCSLGGMVALYVTGAYFVQVARLNDQAAAACDTQGNDTMLSLALINETGDILTQAGIAASVQAILEAIALLLISTAYLILVPLSVAMFRRAERVGARALLSVAAGTNGGDHRTGRVAAIVDDAIHAAAEQRQRLLIACVVVLITFPARAAFDLLNAYSVFNDTYNPACGQCDPCQSQQYIINEWISYTPEFQPIVVALSSPLPLALSLWIITGAHTLAYAISLNILRARLGGNSPGS